MTNQEAIETIKTAIAEIEWNYPLEYAVAFEKAIEALKKQVPKKPIKSEYSDIIYRCPVCDWGKFVIPEHYCNHCGQALDWSD